MITCVFIILSIKLNSWKKVLDIASAKQAISSGKICLITTSKLPDISTRFSGQILRVFNLFKDAFKYV